MRILSPTSKLVAGIGAIILTGAVVALAQPESETIPAQATDDPLVPSASASHIALLSGPNAVPPVETAGTGAAWILFDPESNTLAWTVEYDGLTGPVVAAHFHGPADADANAGVVLGLVIEQEAVLTSPIQGTAELTQEQAAGLDDGMWYVNLHTAANPGGEIRGQVVIAPEPVATVTPVTPVEDDPVLLARLIREGESLFNRNCRVCHGAEGEGSEGERLAGNTRLASVGAVVRQVIAGGAYMPPFDGLTDRQVAAVGTYIRNSFGNSYGLITEDQVAQRR